MATDNQPTPSSAQSVPPPSGWRWLRRGCGCLAVVALLSCCCCGGVSWFMTSSHSDLGETVERVHRDVLFDGDADRAWDHAVPAFKEKHTKDELAKFLGLYDKFRRGTLLPGAAPKRLVIDGETYLILEVTAVAWFAESETVWFVCRVESEGKLRVVGIRSQRLGDLDGALPEQVRSLTKPRGSGWDWD